MAGSSSLNNALSASTLINSVGQYSTSEVAELVGLKATQVRHYVRRDLLSPLRGHRGEFRFSFQDVVMLRSAKVLLDADVPVRRANRVLLDLKARNADASRPLSSLRVQAEGTRVVVQEGNQAWDAESGQGTLPFLFDDVDETNDRSAANKVATLSILGTGTDLAAGHHSDDFQDFEGLDEFAAHLAQETEALLGPKERARRDAALKLLETLRNAGLTGEPVQTDQFEKQESPATGFQHRQDIDPEQAQENAPAELQTGSGNGAGSPNGSKAELEGLEGLKGEDSELIRVSEANQLTSDDWYNLALDLEEADPDKAPSAYRQALSINPQNADAQVNLGRLCQLRGNLKQARRHYKLALVDAPEHQLANYNMGTIYDELDEFDTAREYYIRAKNIPDAHYNLARLFEVRGDELAALRHMREYRRLLEVDISGR